MKFPHDAPKQRVIHTFLALGFTIIRSGNHISLERLNPDGTKTPMTIPNHETIKGLPFGRSARRPGFHGMRLSKRSRKHKFRYYEATSRQ
jgi:hypothetical protein